MTDEMNNEQMESIRKNNASIVKDICSKYGLYGNVIYYEPSPIPGSSLNRMYIVAGTDPVFSQDKLPQKLHVDKMVQTIQRNDKLFYPRAWALDLSECKDELSATNRLVEYCSMAELITKLYAEYNLPPPVALRVSEVYQLLNYRNGLNNPLATPEMKRKYRSDLNWFFKREKSKSTLRQNWLKYFRSEKFPDNKGPIGRIAGFLKREECEIPIHQLMECNNDINKLELQEYEYRIFKDIIQKQYPYVSYAAGDKEIVDHGISKSKKLGDDVFGKYVTSEEFAVIRKDRFADEGWDCVANLKPAYWEFRNVYYRECDEPIIASVYQYIALQYAKCNQLGELKSRGPLRLQKVPLDDFMNFVSLAKSHNLRFYIDYLGEYEKPSLQTIHVLYNVYQQDKMDCVVDQMIHDKISYSHALPSPKRPSLNTVIHQIEENKSPNDLKNIRSHPPFEK